MQFLIRLQSLLNSVRGVDFLAPLALRLYLAPVFWMSGTRKLGAIEDTAAWFGNKDWGLGLPFPTVQAWMVTLFEIGGAVLLVLGLATRWISIPLMVIMVVAALTLHGANGWLVIADDTGIFASERTIGAVERLDRAKAILQEHGNYDWLTANGSFVVLNNGIEFVATYFIMLLTLLMIGGGRYASIDYWIARRLRIPADSTGGVVSGDLRKETS